MGHEHHFLSRLDRVSAPHVDMALDLYRDHKLLRYILATSDLPEGTDRVAISLAHPTEGPFLLVTRDGHFVTCLAEGMRPGRLPVLTREQLDGKLVRAAEIRAQRAERGRILDTEGGARRLFQRLLSAGDELPEEDFVALSAFQPLLVRHFLRIHLDVARRLPEIREDIVRLFKRTVRPKPATHPLLRAYWNGFWALGNTAILATLNGPVFFGKLEEVPLAALTVFTKTTIHHGILDVALRGVWSAAKLGKLCLAAYKKAYDEAVEYVDILEASLALTAIGLRHVRLRAEVRKCVANRPPRCEPDLAEWAEALARLMVCALDSPDTLRALHQAEGARWLVNATFDQPPGSPFRFTRVDDVPEELALRVAIHDRSNLLTDSETQTHAFMCLPWLARASAAQLYLPAGLLRVLHKRWEPRDTLDLVEMLVRSPKPAAPAGPAPVARKALCPCGSGKKYKRCCEVLGASASAGPAAPPDHGRTRSP